jgi:indolepyruvate ferredoxin oxidoreductase alpha subunit
MRRLLSGLQAVARGALESGVHLVAGCPGLFTSEILEAAEAADLHRVATSSEEEAVLVARGAATGGALALAVLGPGGLEAAAGALAAASRGGAPGLLVVVCDDPSGRLAPASDARLAARAAMLPLLEPADPAECRDFVAAGLELSARFETPVVLRLTALLADAAASDHSGLSYAQAALISSRRYPSWAKAATA